MVLGLFSPNNQNKLQKSLSGTAVEPWGAHTAHSNTPALLSPDTAQLQHSWNPAEAKVSVGSQPVFEDFIVWKLKICSKDC